MPFGKHLNRPGLVDNAPGFLGLETFTDAEDASVFYLITRWTSAESFHRWHSGPDHKHSHQGIPKGLKLDPSCTLVRTLHRIPGPPGASAPSDAVRDLAPVIAEFLAQCASVHWLTMRRDGVIAASNPATAKTIGGARGALNGVTIWPLMAEPDAAELRSAVESGNRDPAKRYRFNFGGRDHMPFTLECHLDVQPDGFTLIGEAAQWYEPELERELTALNNRLAVLLRENDRQTKALRKANAELEKAMADLRESHWHLKKIQEFLPICLRCGKVKTSDSQWEDVVEYLKRNSLFLSHGYCPACLSTELEALDG